jgi:hypothetical protein
VAWSATGEVRLAGENGPNKPGCHAVLCCLDDRSELRVRLGAGLVSNLKLSLRSNSYGGF